MAQPLQFRAQVHNDDPQPFEQARTQAVESAFELLVLLDERGVLDLLRGLLGAGDKLVTTVAAAADTPEAIRAIRNFMLLTKFFASIPPEVLGGLVQATAAGASQEKARKAPGLVALFRRLASEDTRHALSISLDLLEAIGKSL